MTEGPTARLRAIQIKDRFLNDKIKDIKVKSKRLYEDPEKLVGRRLKDSYTYGKNIILDFSPYGIRIHLMMYGSIRFEREFSKPENRVRLIIDFESGRMIVYNAPIVEIDLLDRIENRLSEILGFDPLSRWDKDKLYEVLTRNKNRVIGELLLDQRIFAGIGNILRNEILFRAGIRPDRVLSDIPEEKIRLLIKITKELSEEFLNNKIMGKGIKELLMVYNSKYCKKCKGKITFYRDEITGRKTFFCQNCQS